MNSTSKNLFLLSFLFLAFLTSSLASVQLERDTTKKKRNLRFEIPKYRIGISPTAIMGPFPAIQLSQDFRVNNFVEASLETGFVFSSRFNSKGARVRGSLEMYLLRDRIVGMFVGVSVTSVNMWEQFNYTILYEDTYEREFTTARYRSMFGMYLTSGLKFHLGESRFLEISGGMGPASLYNSRIQGPQDIDLGGPFPSTTGWNTIFGFYTNINLSFPLRGM